MSATSANSLVEALLGDDRNRRYMYQTSRSFRHAIDYLAEVILPAMLDGLMVQAYRADEKEAEALALLRNHPGPLVVDPLDWDCGLH